MGLNYNPASVTQGLVYYLDFTNTRCYSGSGNTLINLANGAIGITIVSGITYDTDNRKNLNFNGSSGYMTGNDTNLNFSTSDFTIQTTLKLNGLSNGFSGSYGSVICAGTSSTNNSSIFRFSGTATSHYALALWHEPTGTAIERNYNFQTNKIYNLAVTKRFNVVEFFVDGASIGTTTTSNNFNFTANGFTIGRWYFPGFPLYLKGNIYDFRAYNRALSIDEIQQNYFAQTKRYYNEENIVANGLILNFDSSKANSYSGVGNTIYDLSGFGNTGTLTNGPTFSGLNGGAIVFDGTNDNIPFTFSNYGTTLSIEMWAKLKNFHLTMPFGFYEYDVFTFFGSLGFNTNNSDVYGISSTAVTNLGIANNWTHYIFEMRTDVSYTNNKIYINGNLQTLGAIVGTEDASKRTFNNGIGRISGYYFSPNSYAMSMDLSQFKIYNRALTQQEISQNFNATRSRFGI